MKPLRTAAARLRALFQKRQLDAEMDAEMRSHIEMLAQANVDAGMNPEEARLAALRRFGWAESIKEESRERRGVRWLENLLQDAGYGLRMLRKAPAFTTVVVLSLALGVGAATAIYSVVNRVLLDPIPGPQSERLMQIAEEHYHQGGFAKDNNKPFFAGVSPPVFQALEANRDFFSDFAWYEFALMGRKTTDFVESELGVWVSPNFFSLLRFQPLLGRTFAKDEATPVDEELRPVKDSEIVISYAWWRSQFGGDPRVIGRSVELSGRWFTVIGVMPPHFQFPGPIHFWMATEPPKLRPGIISVPETRVLVRLKPGDTERHARAMLETVARRLSQDYPSDQSGYGREWARLPHGLGLWIRPLRYEFQGGHGSEDLRRTLFGLLGAIGFVLLIVCANIGNLTLARTETRQQELGIRMALGAGRGRLVRQLLTENVILACVGGLAGLVVAVWALKVLVLMIPGSMPRLKEIGVDGRALGFTLLVSLLSAFLFGLAPAWRARGTRLSEALKQAGTGATAGAGRGVYRSSLVVAEVALALVLLAGAGLMIQSVVRLLHVDPGFDPQNLLYVRLSLPQSYNDPRHQLQASALRSVLYDQLHDRIAGLPGVIAFGVAKHAAWPEKLKVDGREDVVELLRDGCGIERNDFFKVMRVPLRAGRYFDQRDLGEGAGTAIISETMAQTCWPGENPIGKRFGGHSIVYGDCGFQVVGVVDDIRDERYDQPMKPIFYRPCHELRFEGFAPFLVIRTRMAPGSLVPAILKEMKAAEPAMEKPGVQVVRQTLYDSTQAQRTYMLYMAAFAGAGLLLSAIGIYGVLAYSVARRTREIGIRMAMGAQRGQVLGMVMGYGARLVAAGIAVGLLAAFWLTRLLEHQLYQVSPQDPMVFAGVVLVLFLVALLACVLPAIRATRVDPMTALRYE